MYRDGRPNPIAASPARGIGLALALALSLGLVSSASALRSEGGDGPATDLDLITRVDANQIDMVVTNNGSFGYDIPNGLPGLNFPRGTGHSALFAGGVWMGARVNGQVRVAVAEYSWEYRPGQILSPTQWSDPNDPVYRVYKISPGDTPASNPDYADWPSQQGAPVDPNGDPRHLGNQTLWSVYHDLDPSAHQNDAGQTLPLGVEIQQTTFASAVGGAGEYIVFLEWKVINKAANLLEDAYISVWSDPDLGGASDDLVACDPAASLGFCYQADDSDVQYGVSAPAVGFHLFQGPIVPSPGDEAYVSGESVPGFRNLPMTAFAKYINGTDPSSGAESYNYMRGLHPDGTPIIDPTTGDPTTFMMSGDPVGGTGWLDTNPGDRRMALSSGPFTMAPGDEQTIAIAVVIGQGNDRLASISVLRENAALAPLLFRSAYGDEDGACCVEDEACRVTYAADCTDGLFRVSEPCDPDPCGAPMGACCFDNGICLPMFTEDCTGDYQGDASTCTPGLCRVYGPPSACCLDGGCEVILESVCVERGGSYYSDALCPLLPPGQPRGWQRNDLGNLMIDEVAGAGGGHVPPDSHGGPGNDVWHSLNSTGDWLLSAGGGAGDESRFTNNGANIRNLTEDDPILKWDHDPDNYGWWVFDNGATGPIPFGLYERDPYTGEETRLIPIFFSGGGTPGVYDISPSTPDPFSGFPATDWCYAYRFDPAVASYQEWLDDARDGRIDGPDPTTVELFRRLILASEDFSVPADGTAIQFSTNKSGVFPGSGFDLAVPIAWLPRDDAAPCFVPEYEVFRDGAWVGSTARTDFLDETVLVNGQTYEYQIRSRNPNSGEVSELSTVFSATPLSGGYADPSGVATAPPIIDGIVGTLEWSSATEIEARPFFGSPDARLRIMNNRTFLYLAIEDAVSAQEVRIYVDANGDGVYGADALEGVIILDHGTRRFVRLAGRYPNVVEIEEIADPAWMVGESTDSSAEIRLTLRVGPLKDRPASDVVSMFVTAPSGVAVYPRGPAAVVSQAPDLFAAIELAEVPPSIPGFSALSRPLLRPGEDVTVVAEIDLTGDATVSCLFRAAGLDLEGRSPGTSSEVGAVPVREAAMIETEPGVFAVTIPAAEIAKAGLRYRVRVVGGDGRVAESEEVLLEVGLVGPLADLKTATSFPNPFQNSTTIAYRAPQRQRVSAAIFDVSGQRLRSLQGGRLVSAGVHTLVWDGRDDGGRMLGSGIYYYRVVGESFQYTRTVTVLR